MMERSPPGEKQDREGAGTNPYAVLSVRVLSGFTPLRSKSRLKRQNRATNGFSANLATRRCWWKCAARPYVRRHACALLWALWPPNDRPTLIPTHTLANVSNSSGNSPGSRGRWSFLVSSTWSYLSSCCRYRDKIVPYLTTQVFSLLAACGREKSSSRWIDVCIKTPFCPLRRDFRR